jgi:hypothetical protein
MRVGVLVKPPLAQLGLQVSIFKVPDPAALVAFQKVQVMPVTAMPPVAHSIVKTLGSKRGATVPEQSRTSGIGSVLMRGCRVAEDEGTDGNTAEHEQGNRPRDNAS